MKSSHVLNCSLPSWYNNFKKVTIPTLFISLPQDFIDYLHEDGVVLPRRPDSGNEGEKDCDSSSQEEAVNWDDCEDCPTSQAPFFPDLDKAIRDAIAHLGGSVFPKLNWSSPRDATWITANHSLQCWTPEDVYILLKSSDFTTHDLDSPFKDCDVLDKVEVSYKLALRKWTDMNPAMEFRCFVKDNNLIGICQRDVTNFYGFTPQQRADIVRDISSFYEESVKGKFPDRDFVLDVYRICKDNVKLVDLNVFGRTTDALLFDWREIDSEALRPRADRSKPDLRCVDAETGIQPNPLRYLAMPVDFLHLATGQDPLKLVDFLKMKIQTEESASSDDEEAQT